MSVEDVQDAGIVEANMDDSSDDEGLINLVWQARPAPARARARGDRGRARGRGRAWFVILRQPWQRVGSRQKMLPHRTFSLSLELVAQQRSFHRTHRRSTFSCSF